MREHARIAPRGFVALRRSTAARQKPARRRHSTAPARGDQSDRRQSDTAGRRSGTVRRQPGDDRLAVEAARLRLPELRDLRRHQRRMGLRAAGRGAQEQRQAGVVAGDGPGARRHRRPGRRHHHGAPGLGHLRPRRQLQRPAGRVPDLPAALPPRRAAGRREPDEHRAGRSRPSSSAWASSARPTGARFPPRAAST